MIEGKKIVADPADRRAVEPTPARTPASPLWIWPHLLSLDAPAVAVGWQAWWAHTQGVRLGWFHHAILGLCVWMIYLADRLADSVTAPPEEWGTPRHAFYHRRRRLLGGLLVAAVAALAVLAPSTLNRREFAGGAALLAATAAYFWLMHGRSGWRAPLPKEAVVGGVFAVGVAFFVAGAGAGGAPGLLGVRTVLFGALCFVNCALISRWERTLRDRRQRSSLINAHPWLVEHLGWCAAGLAALGAAAGWGIGSPLAFAPLALAASGLWALDLARNRIPATALRVLADVALMTPWLFLWPAGR